MGALMKSSLGKTGKKKRQEVATGTRKENLDYQNKQYRAKKKRKQENSESVGDEKLDRDGRKMQPIQTSPSPDGGAARGMKKWLADYHRKRPGFNVLQQQIDDFIEDLEAREEQARKEREAAAAEEGWTVVEHQKGRKKTTDSESGVAVGGVASAAIEKSLKKKNQELAFNFYRFQRREARKNEILELQHRFEEDKKRIAVLRAARKFRPY